VAAPHEPVLVGRVVELLAEAPPGPVVDATIGAGGHALEVLNARATRHGGASLVGIDRDPDALGIAEERLRGAPGEVHLVHARFDALGAVLDDLGISDIAGILFDLGISSMQVDRPERGFSFRHDGPLDMRMDPTAGRTAADLVNAADREELSAIIRRFGEERFAHRVARAIVRARPLTTTGELAEVIRSAVPSSHRGGIDPATRTFQALRIAVNDELAAFDGALSQAIDRLTAGGVVVTLAYHSLEDRIAKRALAEAARGCICPPDLPVCGCGRKPVVELITRGVERPDPAETERNPRARSARLRAARRLPASTGEER
jgi:16S rRNA (cytosine1402-N4)-methyltransferase